MWKKWKQWTVTFMELLFGPPLEDEERDLTDEEIEQLTEELDDYGIYRNHYEQQRSSTDRFGEIKSGNEH